MTAASGPIVVDARGRRCPLPIIDLAAAARDAPPGSRLTLLADDPAADADVAAWCRMRAHTYEGWSAYTPAGCARSEPGDGPVARAYRIHLSG